MGSPEDIAAAVPCAASAEANYVTGTTILVDGGVSLYRTVAESRIRLNPLQALN